MSLCWPLGLVGCVPSEEPATEYLDAALAVNRHLPSLRSAEGVMPDRLMSPATSPDLGS